MRWLIPLIVLVIIEYYCFQAFKTLIDRTRLQWLYGLISLLILVFILVVWFQFDRHKTMSHLAMYTIGLILLIYIPKLIIAFFLLVEDLLRLVLGLINRLTPSRPESFSSFLPARRKFFSQLAVGLSIIPFSSIIYGMAKGRYRYQILKETLYFEDLPEAFNGLKILQLSDIHSGSFDNKEKIKHGIDLINQQDFDLLVFTGDMVNSLSEEMDNWYEVFSKIKTPELGKFSILGNHDYGDYVSWDREADKERNLEEVKAIHPKIGFRLLLNEHVYLKRGQEQIALIGVENWGRHFQQFGDLKKAGQGIADEDFKILLSHDPTHWDLKVQNNPINYHLTLSGHTHGMQFGIEIPGYIKWSPSKYVYPHWAGLYHNKGRYLYVNRGFGYLAYPGRVGIWPEITLLELRKKKPTSSENKLV